MPLSSPSKLCPRLRRSSSLGGSGLSRRHASDFDRLVLSSARVGVESNELACWLESTALLFLALLTARFLLAGDIFLLAHLVMLGTENRLPTGWWLLWGVATAGSETERSILVVLSGGAVSTQAVEVTRRSCSNGWLRLNCSTSLWTLLSASEFRRTIGFGGPGKLPTEQDLDRGAMDGSIPGTGEADFERDPGRLRSIVIDSSDEKRVRPASKAFLVRALEACSCGRRVTGRLVDDLDSRASTCFSIRGALGIGVGITGFLSALPGTYGAEVVIGFGE